MNRKILIVDDAPTLRKVLNFYLSQKGYDIKDASNGKIGLEFIDQEVFDLIILDMNMPILSGAEVLEDLQKRPGFNIPVLILSADKEEESKARGLRLGAAYYMTKPFKPQDVIEKIETILKPL